MCSSDPPLVTAVPRGVSKEEKPQREKFPGTTDIPSLDQHCAPATGLALLRTDAVPAWELGRVTRGRSLAPGRWRWGLSGPGRSNLQPRSPERLPRRRSPNSPAGLGVRALQPHAAQARLVAPLTRTPAVPEPLHRGRGRSGGRGTRVGKGRRTMGIWVVEAPYPCHPGRVSSRLGYS